MTMAFDGYNGGPLMNPLARIQAAAAERGECPKCFGRGGTIERQDPVGDGVGFETFLNACPGCLGQGRCPRCGMPVDALYYCDAEDCDWNPETVNDPHDADDWD